MGIKDKLIENAVKLFGCDAASIAEYTVSKNKFMILGWNRRSEGSWFKAGPGKHLEPFNFDYVERKCVASGVSWGELWKAALKYKRLLGMNMLEAIESGELFGSTRGRNHGH